MFPIRLSPNHIRTRLRQPLASARVCVLVAVSGALAACGGSSSQSQPFKLLTTGTLRGGENTSLSFEAPAGLLVLRVQQSGADLSVALRHANGSIVSTANSPGRRVGSEYVTWQSPKAGSYIAVISAVQTGTPGGGFSAQLLELADTNKHLQAGFASLSDAFALNTRPDADKESIAKLLEASLSSFQRARYRQGMWEAAHQLASLNFWDRYHWQEAMRYAELSREYADGIGDQGAVAHALMLKGAIDIEMVNAVTQTAAPGHEPVNRLRNTEATLERAAQMHRQLGNRFAEAECLNFLAMSSYAQSDLDRAATLLRGVASTYAALGERANEIMALQSLQSLDLQNGNYRTASRTLKELLRLADRQDDPVFYAGLMNEYGLALSLTGKPDEAIKALLEASRQYAAQGRTQDSADSLQGLAGVYRRQGDIDQALDLMAQVLEIRHQFPDNTRSLFSSLTATSDLLRESGRTSEARSMAAEAIPLAARASEIARINLVVARIAIQRREYREAEGALRKLENAGLPETHRYRLDALLERVRLQIFEGHYDSAIDLLTNAEGLSERANAIYEQYTSRYLATLALSRKGELSEALLAAEDTVKRLEELRSASMNPDLRGALLASRRDAYRLRVEILMRMSEASTGGGPRNEMLERALVAADSSRARVLRDVTGVGPDISDPSEANRRHDLYMDLAGKRYRYDQLRERDRVDTEAVARLAAEITNLRVSLDQLPGELTTAHRDVDFDIRALQRLQGQLAEDTTLVEYMLGPDRSWAWIVRRSEILVVQLSGRESIDTAARSLMDSLKSPGGGLHVRHAADLARLAIEPLAQHLTGHVIFVLDGSLLEIPPALLVDGSTARERVRSVAITPAIGMLSNSSQAPVSDGPPRVLVVSGTRAGAELPLLRATEREAGYIKQAAKGRPVTLFTGPDSERSRVLDALADGYSLIHFATHAVVDTRDYRLSYVALGASQGNDRLYLSDLDKLRLNEPLIVLSACETARGRMLDGEGMLGFGSTYLKAGANTLVLSHWRVPDESTARLMQLFYANLFERPLSPEESLLRAQHEFRGRFPQWSHPYYWAGFGVITRVIRAHVSRAPEDARLVAWTTDAQSR